MTRSKLIEYYQKAGYNQVSDHLQHRARSRRRLRYRDLQDSSEGAKVKITDIRFVGNKSVKRRCKLQAARWKPRSGGCSPGSPAPAASRTTSLRTTSTSSATTTASTASSISTFAQEKVVFSYPSPDKLLHHVITVVEGRQLSRGRNQSFTGNKLYDDHAAEARRPASAPALCLRALQASTRTRERARGLLRQGRLPPDQRVRISPASRIIAHRAPSTSTIKIVRRARSTTSSPSSSRATTKTKSTVILRELVLGPGDVFSKVHDEDQQAAPREHAFLREHVNVTDAGDQHPRPPQHAHRRAKKAARGISPSAPASARWSAPRSSPKSPSPISTSSTAAPSSRAMARSSASALQLGSLSSEVGPLV